jgi:uncharacterized protein (DUF58 family)
MITSSHFTHSTSRQHIDDGVNDGAYVSLAQLQQLRHTAKQYLVASGKSNAPLNGQHRSRAVSRGMEFEDVRPYQAGDDIRSIDWRVTARTQVTHSKRYSEEKEKPIVTVVDQRRSSFFGSHPCFKSVYSCQLAALVNWATLSAGDRSGGIVLGSKQISETRPARSHKTVNRWLQQLSTANQQLSATVADQFSMSDCLKRVIHTTQTGTDIVLISDCYDLDDECEKQLFYLSRHHRITLLWVVDQLEIALPKTAQITVSDGHATRQLPLQHSLTQQFSQHHQNKEAALQQLCQRLRIRLIKAPVQTPAHDIAMGVMS